MTVTYSNKMNQNICKTVYNLQQVLTYVDLPESVNDLLLFHLQSSYLDFSSDKMNQEYAGLKFLRNKECNAIILITEWEYPEKNNSIKFGFILFLFSSLVG